MTMFVENARLYFVQLSLRSIFRHYDSLRLKNIRGFIGLEGEGVSGAGS